MVRTHPARRERDEGQPEQEMQIRPEHQPRDGMRRLQHVVVVIPIDTQVDEAQHVAQEDGDHGPQRLDALAVGHLHLQHHDGDEDGDYAITERFQPILSHTACARAHRNCHCTTMATADGNEKSTRKTGSSSRHAYPPCATPIPMFAAAVTNQMTTNATVAVIIDEVFELARSFATPRQAVHSTKPTAMMLAVRIATSRRFLLVGEMVAETERCRSAAPGSGSGADAGGRRLQRFVRRGNS